MFRKTTLLLTLFLSTFFARGQTIEEFYNLSLREYDKGNLDQAITYLDSCIAMNAEISGIWYNRGVFHSKQGEFENSISDFSKAIQLEPNYLKAYNNRGNSYQDIGMFDKALIDYQTILDIDSTHIDALWNMAETYEKLNDTLTAAYKYKIASSLGDEMSLDKLNLYRKEKRIKDPKLELTETANDKSYGYSEKNPVYVGANIYTGPQSERYYLDQLSGPNGEEIEYSRLKSCCPYETENGLMGYGRLDVYEITYTIKNGKKITLEIYFSMYDWAPVFTPIGLSRK